MKIDLTSDINKDYYDKLNYGQIDDLLVKFLWGTFIFFTLGALAIYYFQPASFYPSPFSWLIMPLDYTLYAIAFAFIATLIPAMLRGKMKNHYHYRLIITAALVVYDYLFVFITGGSIEAHFTFFVVFTMLVTYYDWRLGWFALVLTGLHHFVLNYLAPQFVYFYGRNDVALVAHVLPVLIAVLFTTWLSNNTRDIVTRLDKSKTELAVLNSSLEVKVSERTKELENAKSKLAEKLSEVERLNAVMTGREKRMVELKEEIAKLKKSK